MGAGGWPSQAQLACLALTTSVAAAAKGLEINVTEPEYDIVMEAADNADRCAVVGGCCPGTRSRARVRARSCALRMCSHAGMLCSIFWAQACTRARTFTNTFTKHPRRDNQSISQHGWYQLY